MPIFDHTFTAGHEQDADIRVMHDLTGRLDRRLWSGSDQIRRSACADNRPIEQLDVLHRHQGGVGMDVERRRVAGQPYSGSHLAITFGDTRMHQPRWASRRFTLAKIAATSPTRAAGKLLAVAIS